MIYTHTKPEIHTQFSKGLMEIISLVQAKYGDSQTFDLEMGNFTSEEYGSYKLMFRDSKNTDVILCTVIYDFIFGEIKIYEGGNK